MKDKDVQAGKSSMLNDTIIDYIVSLTHLYGLVHKDKTVEIFNLQNKEKIDIMAINDIAEKSSADLMENFTKIKGDYFVHEAIIESRDFDKQLKRHRNKPLYIPPREELLKYKDDTYFEVNKEYQALVGYVTNNICDGDESAARTICEDVQGVCQSDHSIREIFDVFNTRGVVFESDKQVREVIWLATELANNTRIWENNGHTPREIFEQYEKPHLRPLPGKPLGSDSIGIFGSKSKKKIGRNDPCPCGSGKKYKKCCLGKYEGN